MPGIYLYGVVGYPPPLARGILGLGDSPVFLVRGADLAAVASQSPFRAWPIDEAHVAGHEAVVEAIMALRPILPMQYNSVLPSRHAVSQLLQRRSHALQCALRRVGRKVELGLRVLGPASAPEAASGVGLSHDGQGPGTSYLCRRLAEERRRTAERERGQRLIGALRAQLDPLGAESRIQPFLTERLVLSAAYLIERERVAAFQDRVAAARQRFPGFGFLLTGPWPPYHFANGSPDD